MSVEAQKAPAPIQSGLAVIIRKPSVIEYIEEGIAQLPKRLNPNTFNDVPADFDDFIVKNIAAVCPTRRDGIVLPEKVREDLEEDTFLAADFLTERFLKNEYKAAINPLGATFALITSAAIAEAVQFGIKDPVWSEFLVRTGAQLMGTSVLKKVKSAAGNFKSWEKYKNLEKTRALHYLMNQIGEGTLLHEARETLGIKYLMQEVPVSAAVLDLSMSENGGDGLSPWRKEAVYKESDSLAFTNRFSSRPAIIVFPAERIDDVLSDPLHPNRTDIQHEYCHSQRITSRVGEDGIIFGSVFEEYIADFVSRDHVYLDAQEFIDFLTGLAGLRPSLMADVISENRFSDLMYAYTRRLGPRATILALIVSPYHYGMREDNAIPGVRSQHIDPLKSLQETVSLVALEDRDRIWVPSSVNYDL